MRPNTEWETENLKSPHLTGNDDADNEKDKDKLTGTSPTDNDGANHILPGGNTSLSSTATAKADNIDGTLNKEDVRQTVSFPLSKPISVDIAENLPRDQRRRFTSLVSNLTSNSEDEEFQKKTVSKGFDVINISRPWPPLHRKG